MAEELSDEFLSLGRINQVLRRRAALILVFPVVLGLLATGYCLHKTKQYTATASIVFNGTQLAQEVSGLQSVNDTVDPQAQQDTNMELVKLSPAAASTAAKLRHGMTRRSVQNSLAIAAVGDTNVVSIAAKSDSPRLAADIANTYAHGFVASQQGTNRAYFSGALTLVNKQLAAMSQAQRASSAGLALEDRAQSLEVLAQIQSGGVEIAQRAVVPAAPSSPKTLRDILLAALIGLILGLAVAFGVEQLDQRIRDPEDLQTRYVLPLLGVVPESQSLSRARGSRGTGTPAPEVAEAFQLIRAHLRYFNVDREVQTMMISSAAPGDGKSTVASQLANAAARIGVKTLLVEADLRRPTLADYIGVERNRGGLCDVLIGSVEFRDAVVTVYFNEDAHKNSRSLDVLLAGAVLPPNPAELLESHSMEALLDRVRASYQLIVLDTPPLSAVSDAFPLLAKVDGTVIVGRLGQTRREEVTRLHATLTAADVTVLGVIANSFRAGRGNRGYAYGYGYGTERS